jgi:protein O-mannosyl-transferase
MNVSQNSEMGSGPISYRVMACLLLAMATLLVYWQVTGFDYITTDDPIYVTENSAVQLGISLQSIRWAFTSVGYASNWHPLTWMSHMLDVQLFGMNPGMHHLVNVVFHVLNAILLLVVLGRLTGSFWKSAAVAALFALHPLHVESVAWISERKDVLSTFFFLLTLGSYSLYAGRSSAGRYLAVVLFFVLGLLAKPMVVTLPFVLLLLDFWPLNRLALPIPGQDRGENLEHSGKRGLAFLTIEKLPLFALSFLSCFLTYWAQKSSGAVSSLEAASLGKRLANAAISSVTYIVKTFWPLDLGVFYPYPETINAVHAGLSVALILLVTGGALFFMRRLPYLLVGWLWFIGTLVPVVGIVQVGAQAMADRYTYIPLTGLFIIIVWGITDLFDHWNVEGWVRYAPLLAFPLYLWSSWVQVGFWQNSQMLYAHTLEITSGNYSMHNALGTYFQQHRKYDEAIREYQKALDIRPNFFQAQNNIGSALLLEGRYDEAISHLQASLNISPHQAYAYNNLGLAYMSKGEYEKAAECFRNALPEDPGYAQARANLLKVQAKLETGPRKKK